MDISFEDVGEALSKLIADIAPVLPAPLQAPVQVVGVVLRDVAGYERTVSTAAIAARETAAGEAAHKAAKLAGMREAVGSVLTRYFGVHGIEEPIDAIMAEIARRL